MSEEYSKEFKILLYIISGIAVASFIYLIYKDWKNSQDKLIDTIQLSENNDIKYILKNQETIISNQHEQISNIIKLINTKPIQQVQQVIPPVQQAIVEKPKDISLLAGNVKSLKSTPNDKIRQSMFGLL